MTFGAGALLLMQTPLLVQSHLLAQIPLTENQAAPLSVLKSPLV